MMKATIGTILIIAYFANLIWFFPKGRRTLDVFKLNPKLFPYWWKIVGLIWIAVVLVIAGINGELNPSANDFLLSGIYFGLLQIAFSKEKNEDEFVFQIRTKAMYVSVISMLFLAGVFSSFELISPQSFSANAFVWIMNLLNATLVVYLSYFYYSKYGFRIRK